MRYASEEAFWQLSVASTQFLDQVSTAILAAQTKDEAQFKHLAAVMEALDANATHVMAVMNEFAVTKDAEIKVLQNSSTAMKADIAALRKEVKRKPKAADVKKQEKAAGVLRYGNQKGKGVGQPHCACGRTGRAGTLCKGREVRERSGLAKRRTLSEKGEGYR